MDSSAMDLSDQAKVCFFLMSIYSSMSLILQQFVTSHTSGIKTEEMPEVELMSLDTRSYLDRTVVPALLDAMAVVAKER